MKNVFTPAPERDIAKNIEALAEILMEGQAGYDVSDICLSLQKEEAALFLQQILPTFRDLEREQMETALMRGLGHIKIHKGKYFGITLLVRGMF